MRFHFSCIRLDVATDRDLFDFIDDLDVKDTSPPHTKGYDKEEEEDEEEEETGDVWQDIAYALNNWTQRI